MRQQAEPSVRGSGEGQGCPTPQSPGLPGKGQRGEAGRQGQVLGPREGHQGLERVPFNQNFLKLLPALRRKVGSSPRSLRSSHSMGAGIVRGG